MFQDNYELKNTILHSVSFFKDLSSTMHFLRVIDAISVFFFFFFPPVMELIIYFSSEDEKLKRFKLIVPVLI